MQFIAHWLEFYVADHDVALGATTREFLKHVFRLGPAFLKTQHAFIGVVKYCLFTVSRSCSRLYLPAFRAEPVQGT